MGHVERFLGLDWSRRLDTTFDGFRVFRFSWVSDTNGAVLDCLLQTAYLLAETAVGTSYIGLLISEGNGSSGVSIRSHSFTSVYSEGRAHVRERTEIG
jgi:hypothetical protein